MSPLADPLDARPRAARPTAGTTEYSQVLHAVQSLGLMERRYGYYFTKMLASLVALGGVWVAFSFLGVHWAQLGIAVALDE